MLDLESIKARAAGVSYGGTYHEAQARADREALIAEVESLRAALAFPSPFGVQSSAAKLRRGRIAPRSGSGQEKCQMWAFIGDYAYSWDFTNKKWNPTPRHSTSE